MQDFLGREYGPGDLVIYGAHSGRSVNMVIGRVLEVYEVVQSPGASGYLRLEGGQLPPFKKTYGWFDASGCLQDHRKDGFEWREYETDERLETTPKVKIQPLRAARWTQHRGHDYYVDTRNGKRIDPDAPSGKHVLKPEHYVHADATEFDWNAAKATWQDAARRQPGMHRDYGDFEYEFRRRYRVNYGDAAGHELPGGGAKEQLWYVRTQYQPWVEKRHDGPKPVTIEVIDNIVKWEGELPAEVA